MKISVRVDPKKDLINPTFKLKIGRNPEVLVYLSDIRTMFRRWILQKSYMELSLKDNRSIINDFVKNGLFAEIKIKDFDKLIICLTGDIVKRMNGTATTIQQFNSLFKTNNQ